MALESDVLVGKSLAGIGMTAIFVFILNFAGRKENKKPRETTVE